MQTYRTFGAGVETLRLRPRRGPTRIVFEHRRTNMRCETKGPCRSDTIDSVRTEQAGRGRAHLHVMDFSPVLQEASRVLESLIAYLTRDPGRVLKQSRNLLLKRCVVGMFVKHMSFHGRELVVLLDTACCWALVAGWRNRGARRHSTGRR